MRARAAAPAASPDVRARDGRVRGRRRIYFRLGSTHLRMHVRSAAPAASLDAPAPVPHDMRRATRHFHSRRRGDMSQTMPHPHAREYVATSAGARLLRRTGAAP